MFGLDPSVTLLLGAGLLGLTFGVAAERTQFCLLSGLRDAATGARTGRLSAFLLAMLIALAGTQGLILAGLLDVGTTIYVPRVSSIAAVAIGGALFGLGAVLTRGCAGRLTILAATGNLRALIVIVMFAVTAYAAQRGVLAWPRLWLEQIAPSAIGASTLPDLAGPAAATARWALLIAAALAAAAIIVVSRTFASRLVGGAIVGLVVVGGWVVTAVLGVDEFADSVRASSLSFTAPLAATLQYLMTATGAKPDFGILLIAGVLGGSALSAAASGRLALQGFENPRQLLRYLAGAVLMGFGGVLALGCSMGQGLTGVSTLSFLSLTALASIVAGMLAGLRLSEAQPSAAAARDKHPMAALGAR